LIKDDGGLERKVKRMTFQTWTNLKKVVVCSEIWGWENGVETSWVGEKKSANRKSRVFWTQEKTNSSQIRDRNVFWNDWVK